MPGTALSACISSFPIGMLFISFSCLVALVRTTKTISDRNDERAGILALFLILEEKTFSFSPLSMRLLVGVFAESFYHA